MRGRESEASPRRPRTAAGPLRLVAAFAVLALLAIAAPAAQAAKDGKRATATGTGGAAATVDSLATKAAVAELRDGGNAVDAAVTAAGVLGVTEPFSAGIGGGGFMLIRTPSGKVRTIDGRETAPAAMNERSFFEDGKPLGFDAARYSGLSAGVPGTPATWDVALNRFGTISLAEALEPGARVAREGFRVDSTFSEQIGENTEYFDDVPATAALYLDADGTPLDAGTQFTNPDLANAYDLIGQGGAAAFYEGPMAAAITAAAQSPQLAPNADHTFRPGLITAADLAAYEAKLRKPTRIDYRDYEVWGMAPPSSGGSTVGEILNILEGYNRLAANPARSYHRFLEASRYAYADRGAYLGDPAFTSVPLAGLLSDRYAAKRRALIGRKAADKGEVDPGKPPGSVKASTSGPDREGVSTTHLTVVDKRGMTVSYTFTIESTGGNAVVVPGYGFLLNNELTDFTYDDPGAANAPAAGKRPRSSIAPTLVTRDGKPVLALGTPGGSTIITTVAQILLERLDLGSSLPEAIAAPRVSEQNSTEAVAEPTFIRSKLGNALRELYGHAFTKPDPAAPPEIGAANGIEFLRGGRLLAVAEPERRGGGAAGVVKPARPGKAGGGKP